VLEVLAALFVAALVAPALVNRFGPRMFLVLALAPAGGFAWLIARLPAALNADQHAPTGAADAPPGVHLQWIPTLSVALDLRLDALAAILCLLVLGVGTLVLVYCARYFDGSEEGLGGFAGNLTAFAAAMFGLITADDLVVLFVFWEITTILSYLLIGFQRRSQTARRSALQALLVTTAGGLAMLVGVIGLTAAAGTGRISTILERAPELMGQPVVTTSVILLLVGAFSKSALIPLHFWLPGAMAAPTPVSAYLHAAAMVKAGVYLVARMAPGFADSPGWRPLVITLGIGTLLLGGWRALRQHDLKLVLAYGTVSQLGFLTLVTGLGSASAALAGSVLLLSHGLFKSALFLIVGIIDHVAGTRDLRALSGLWRRHPVLLVCAIVSAASMAGVPVALGFVAKEAVLDAVAHLGTLGFGPAGIAWLLAAIVTGSVLTFAYAARFVWGAFATKPGERHSQSHRVPAAMGVPVVLLSAATLVLGIRPQLLEPLLAPAAHELPGPMPHLALWHGLTLPLGLTALTLVIGTVLFLARGPVEALQARMPRVPDAGDVYARTVAGTDRLATLVTGAVQRGQLSYYVLVILVTALVVPTTAAVLATTPWPDVAALRIADNAGQLLAGAAIIVGAVWAVRSSKRFMAVLMVSLTGYGIAAVFAFQGAPDLALTQVLVETVSLVAIVLALRVLPSRMDRPGEPGSRSTGRLRSKAVRWIVSIGFGLAMMAIAAIAMTSRSAAPISQRFAELAYEGGHGRNIINVTLVDLRAWDTFGEITVLTAAATGVASLVFVVGRGDRIRRAADVEPGSVDRTLPRGVPRRIAAVFAGVAGQEPRTSWLVAGRTLAPERRSIIVEVVTRLLFHTLLLLSVYLLLAGHNTPGGGFAGGLVAGLALTLRYLAGGRVELFEAIRVGPGTLLGSGLALAAVTGLAPLAFGGAVFQSLSIEFWFLGEHTFVTGTFFDLGVYLIVIGLVLDVLTSLGAEIDHRRDVVAADRTAPASWPVHGVREAAPDVVVPGAAAEAPEPAGAGRAASGIEAPGSAARTAPRTAQGEAESGHHDSQGGAA